MKQNKLMPIFLGLVLILSSIHAEKIKANSKQLDLTVPAGAKIFYQGWLKYYYTSSPTTVPEMFFTNERYSKQRYPSSESSKSDQYGSFVIPDKSSFFAVLYKNNLSIYSARDKIEMHSVDNLLIDQIYPVPEDEFTTGGIQNFGFFKAGHCVKVRTKKPSAYGVTNEELINWYFCFNDANQKSTFITSLAKVKILDQRSKDQFVTSEQKNDTQPGLRKEAPKEDTSKDGKLMLLQDWTECDLKCGGGQSYQQWMCIPPKEGGKPCLGELFRSKSCNEQPCPVIRSAEDDKANQDDKNSKFVKPIVKITRFSQRYNRYSKCVLNETDIFKVDAENNKLPARIIMNPHTLCIYNDDDYLNKDYCFNLSETEFVKKNFCCFELTDRSQKLKYCGFDTACGEPKEDPNIDPFVDDLSAKFYEFKKTCNSKKRTHLITDDDMKKIEKSKSKEMEMKNFEVETKKAEQVNEQLSITQSEDTFHKVQEVQELGLKALDRELMIEQLIKEDEEKREITKENAIMEELQNEKRKNNSIDRQIEEKALENAWSFDTSTVESDKEVKAAVADTMQIIEVNRDHLRSQINEIRKQAKKRQAAAKQKVQSLKTKISQKVMEANKVGNKDTCINGLGRHSTEKDPSNGNDARKAYCEANYHEDFNELQFCKNFDNFCYYCCDNEFGLMKPAERDTCHEACDLRRDKLREMEVKLQEKNARAANNAKFNKDRYTWVPPTD